MYAPAAEGTVQGMRRESVLRAPAHSEHVQGLRRGAICEHQRIRSRCKECIKQADQASAYSDLPRAAGGKRGAREAGLGEAGAAKKLRPT